MSSIPANIYYPQVSGVQKNSQSQTDKLNTKEIGSASEFSSLLNEKINLKEPLKFSAHALQRMTERKLNMDEKVLTKINEAIDKADAKGVIDTLVLTEDAALIVSVKNRTIVTAMDRNALNGNVFTNIDGAVIV